MDERDLIYDWNLAGEVWDQPPFRIQFDDETLRFWVGLGTLKWGVICIGQAFAHLGGLVRSVELATLGRRVAEMEWDVLDVIEGGW